MVDLRYITCSDPRENTNIGGILTLAEISPLVEIAVQAHPSKMSDGMPRNKWFKQLIFESMQLSYPLNLAVHVNKEWCHSLCNGHIPYELQEWMQLNHTDTFSPIIRRWQLNLPLDTAKNLNPYKLAAIIHDFPCLEFIVQYNQNTKSAVAQLNKTGVNFSLLFDASGGTGKVPNNWQSPIYKHRPTGYAGGLGPSNVAHHLDKISGKISSNYFWNNKSGELCNTIWIDAEGKLKNTKKEFDIERAKVYIKNALAWRQK